MSLGNHFFHARKNKGLSQEEVAEKLGISRHGGVIIGLN